MLTIEIPLKDEEADNLPQLEAIKAILKAYDLQKHIDGMGLHFTKDGSKSLDICINLESLCVNAKVFEEISSIAPKASFTHS